MKLYNSMSGKKEEFKTLTPGEVKMYVCGPTVYNYFHIGNARPFLIFDAFRKYLKYRGYKVTYVQNFTDVDDKIIRRANEEGVDSLEISERYIQEYFKDADALGIARADIHPKVTETIPEIIGFVKTLIEKGNAYEVEGDVYFDAKSYEGYGKLSGQKIDELEVGARVELNTVKKNPVDFALWKKKKTGEPSWDSPWGQGRPGWHIECSVMSTKYLGETIDIHAGGQDLIFPHHENEIAQSECHSGHKFSNYWIHNGYININNEKMSKSKNNFFTVREILEDYEPEVVRFFLLSAHYRNPVNFSRDLIVSAGNSLERIYTAKENLEYLLEKTETAVSSDSFIEGLNKYRDQFITAMDDDFNTADGITAIFDLVKYLNVELATTSSKEDVEASLALMAELTGVLGILTKEKDSLDQEIEGLIQERQEARKNKDFARSDEIRDILKDRGIVLKDTPEGVKWHYDK